jgi:hypothetical protein
VTRYIIIVAVSLSLVACSDKSEFVSNLGEFEYPMDSLRRGKTFVFKKNGSDQCNFIDRKVMTVDGVDYLSVEVYDDQFKKYSERWEMNSNASKLLEQYVYHYPDSQNTLYTKHPTYDIEGHDIDVGKKYPGTFWKSEVTIDFIKGRTSTTMMFMMEDKLVVMGEKRDVLVYSSETLEEAWMKYFPLFGSETEYDGQYTYARGLGLVEYYLDNGEDEGLWTLSEIRDTM